MSRTMPMEDERELTALEQKNRRQRSVAIAVALLALVALVYVVTVFKLGANIVDRPL